MDGSPLFSSTMRHSHSLRNAGRPALPRSGKPGRKVRAGTCAHCTTSAGQRARRATRGAAVGRRASRAARRTLQINFRKSRSRLAPFTRASSLLSTCTEGPQCAAGARPASTDRRSGFLPRTPPFRSGLSQGHRQLAASYMRISC